MDEIIRYAKKISMLVVLYPLKLLKTKPNRVLLDNCLAHNYSDNIKPIAEWLVKRFPGQFEVFVAVNNEEKYSFLRDKGITPIKFHSIKYYIIAMSAAFFITNSGGYSYLPLKNNQFVINTWHGGGAYKKIGVDPSNPNHLYKRDLQLAAKKTTVFTSTCTKFTEVISTSLLIPREVFVHVGMPRNDILVNTEENTGLREIIRARIGLLSDEKLVLYAPTYRKKNDNSFGQSIAPNYGLDPARVCKALQTRFGGKWRFAVRFHPQIQNPGKEFAINNIIDLTTYEDMQELLLAADIMINDFSSSMWDFMLTDKPCFTFATDLEHYAATTKLYTPVEDWPFPKATTNDELEKNILCFDEEKYKADCARHYKMLGGCETGKATEYVCSYIYNHL